MQKDIDTRQKTLDSLRAIDARVGQADRKLDELVDQLRRVYDLVQTLPRADQ